MKKTSLALLLLILTALPLFAEEPQIPVINEITPSKAKAGEQIMIKGSNFHKEKEKNIVRFGNIVAEIKKAWPDMLVVTVPEGAKVCGVTVDVLGLRSKEYKFYVIPYIEFGLADKNLNAGQKTKGIIRVVGSKKPWKIMVKNKYYEIIDLPGGAEQTVITSGGDDNKVEIDIVAKKKGNFSLMCKKLEELEEGAQGIAKATATPSASEAPKPSPKVVTPPIIPVPPPPRESPSPSPYTVRTPTAMPSVKASTTVPPPTPAPSPSPSMASPLAAASATPVKVLPPPTPEETRTKAIPIPPAPKETFTAKPTPETPTESPSPGEISARPSLPRPEITSKVTPSSLPHPSETPKTVLSPRSTAAPKASPDKKVTAKPADKNALLAYITTLKGKLATLRDKLQKVQTSLENKKETYGLKKGKDDLRNQDAIRSLNERGKKVAKKLTELDADLTELEKNPQDNADKIEAGKKQYDKLKAEQRNIRTWKKHMAARMSKDTAALYREVKTLKGQRDSLQKQIKKLQDEYDGKLKSLLKSS
ncbi:MAG: IPT/TIG domain-containing protein [Candidatus Eremiobacteraeota bacterium]|nr:IPT/TIG domain-containing protein [Candidatus Eremiobacteraeota bacterium]